MTLPVYYPDDAAYTYHHKCSHNGTVVPACWSVTYAFIKWICFQHNIMIMLIDHPTISTVIVLRNTRRRSVSVFVVGDNKLMQWIRHIGLADVSVAVPSDARL